MVSLSSCTSPCATRILLTSANLFFLIYLKRSLFLSLSAIFLVSSTNSSSSCCLFSSFSYSWMERLRELSPLIVIYLNRQFIRSGVTFKQSYLEDSHRMIKQPKYLVKFTNAYNDNGTVWYTVKVIHAKEGEEWTFKERYSRMRTIHENCDKGKWKNDLPDFPPRKLFGNTSEEFIQKRKKELENYYSTLFRTVDIDDMPEVLAFFNTNKPVKSKPKGNQRPTEPEHSPEKTEKKEKNIKRIFDEIVIKYEKEMVESNEFDNDIQDETRRKFNIEFQKLKLDLKSKILDIVELPKGDKDNDTDYWNHFFTDSNEEPLKHSELVSKCVSDHLKESSKCHIKFVVAL